MEKCDLCGETKWGNKFPETDSVCCCDDDASQDLCEYCGMTEEEHKTNEWVGLPGHCEGFKSKDLCEEGGEDGDNNK